MIAFRVAPDLRWLLGAPDARPDTVDHLHPRSCLMTAILNTDDGTVGPARPMTMDPVASDQDASLLRLDTGRLLLASFAWAPMDGRLATDLRAAGGWTMGHGELQAQPHLFWGGNVRLSDDDGETWSTPAYLPAWPRGLSPAPQLPMRGGAVRGRAVQLRDGTILLPAYGGHPDSSASGMSTHWRSTDGGETWAFSGPVAADPSGQIHLVEPALIDLGRGRLLALLRTNDRRGRMAVAAGEEGGCTWQPWQWTSAVGHPADAIVLDDGQLLIALGNRGDKPGVRLRLARPKGRGLTLRRDEIVVRDDSLGPDCGYPWLADMGDGSAWVVYYLTDADGVRGIHANRIRF